MDEEIIRMENWVWAWVHRVTGMPMAGEPTGTPWEPNPPYIQRYIQVQDVLIHKDCGGELEWRWATRWQGSCSFTTRWRECMDCHKHFDAEEL
jgi:hypothetical protein